MLYVAVLCSAGLVLPGLRGYTAAGRSAFLFCTGLSLCYLAALVLAAAEVALTGGAGLRELLRPLTRLGGQPGLLFAVCRLGGPFGGVLGVRGRLAGAGPFAVRRHEPSGTFPGES